MRVIVASPTSNDLMAVQQVLDELAIEILQVPRGGPWDQAVDLDRADGAIVVLDRRMGTSQTRLLLQAGIAIGRGMPLLVIHAAEVPFEASRYPNVSVMVGSHFNAEALRFHIKLFAAGSTSEVGRERPAAGSDQTVDVSQFRARLAAIRKAEDGWRHYEEWVADLLRAAGAQLELAPEPDQRGFDMVATVPGFVRGQGPMVVEVKAARHSQQLTDAALRLQYLVLQERAGQGLLLFDEELVRAVVIQVVPMVITLGFNELLEGLEQRNLPELLTNALDSTIERL